ncbi:MAG: transporter [Thermoanaerobaculia bacterium]
MSGALAVAIVALAGTGATLAQEDLVTDRPDQTESAVTVAPGKYHIETGVLHTQDDAGGRSFEVTEALGTLVRIGLRERLELRIGFDGYVWTPGADGIGDGSVGAKILLAEETDSAPRVAVLVESSVPIGDDQLTSDDYAPAFRLALSKDFLDSLGVGLNVGAEFPEDQEILLYTLALGVGLDDKNGVFFEVFGDDQSSHSFDTGWTRLVRPNLQLDVAGGVGISDEAPDWFVGAGLSVRFPD